MKTKTPDLQKAAINKLTEMLNKHNDALPKGVEKVDTKALIDRVIREGGTSLEGLRSFEKKDFIDFGFPRAIASQAAQELQPASKKEDLKSSKKTTKQITGRAADAATGLQRITLVSDADAVRTMTASELFDRYDASNPGLVGDEIKSRSNNQPCVVFADATGTKIHREASAQRLQDIIDGVPVSDFVTIDDEPMIPLRVGERPNTFFAENPLYPNSPLRMPGEVCHVTNESWKDVPHDVRVLLAVAVNRGELRVGEAESSRAIILAAKGDDAMTVLKQRYPRSAAALREMTPAERPTLQIRRNHAPAGGGTRDPFSGKPEQLLRR